MTGEQKDFPNEPKSWLWNVKQGKRSQISGRGQLACKAQWQLIQLALRLLLKDIPDPIPKALQVSNETEWKKKKLKLPWCTSNTN